MLVWFTERMASELTITIWSEGPADDGLAFDLGAAACQTILNQSGGSHRAKVVNAKAFDMPAEFVSAALPVDDSPTTTPTAPAVPPVDPLATPEPDVSTQSPFELPPVPPTKVPDLVSALEASLARATVAADATVIEPMPLVTAPALTEAQTVVVSSPLVAGAAVQSVDTAEAASHASAADNAAAAGAPVEAVSPSVVEVVYPPTAAPLSRSEQEAALEAQLAALQAQDAAAGDANGSAS